MDGCSSKKYTQKPERVRKATEQVRLSAASEGFHQQIPDSQLPHAFEFGSAVENIETEENRSDVICPPRYTSSSKLSNSFNKSTVSRPALIQSARLSELDDETEVVQRLMKAMHKLGRAYQKEGNSLESLKWLKSSWELYEYLGSIEELVVCEGDIAVVHVVEGLQFQPSEYAKVSKDKRIVYLTMSLTELMKNSSDRTKVSEVLKHAKLLDLSDIEGTSSFDSLIETGHMLKLWRRDFPRVLSLYEQALSLSPEKLSTYLFLWITHRVMGNLQEGIKCYNKSLALDQDYSEACVNLGNIYFEDNKDLKHAEKRYVHALKSLEKGFESLVSPGKVYHLLSEAYIEQGFVYNALEMCMKGIGVNSICADNYTRTKVYAEKLGNVQLTQFLTQLCQVMEWNELVEKQGTEAP